jgi:hypothetical protein
MCAECREISTDIKFTPLAGPMAAGAAANIITETLEQPARSDAVKQERQ